MTGMFTFESIVKEFGPLVALIIYYVWRDFLTAKQNVLREVRLIDRVTQLEDFQRAQLTNTLVSVTKTMHEFTEALRSKPCMSDLGRLKSEE